MRPTFELLLPKKWSAIDVLIVLTLGALVVLVVHEGLVLVDEWLRTRRKK